MEVISPVQRSAALNRGMFLRMYPQTAAQSMLQVFPGQTWKVRDAQTDAQGTGTITLYDPTR